MVLSVGLPLGSSKSEVGSVSSILYIDQNAWIALARGAWDKLEYPREHAALAEVISAVQNHGVLVPLSFANIYETMKVNDPVRRLNLARTQSIISRGLVFRGRRRILSESLEAYLAARLPLPRRELTEHWFLSDLWFESAADYCVEVYGFTIFERVLAYIRANPTETLIDYLAFSDEDVRTEAVRQYTAASLKHIEAIEERRARVAGEPLALRRRAYGAQLILDEIDFIVQSGRRLGLAWQNVRDVGSSLLRSMTVDIPVLNAERELAIRLEDQARAVTGNDLRDMAAFTAVLPLADMIIAEKPFVNLAKQARLDERYRTVLLTSIFDFAADLATKL